MIPQCKQKCKEISEARKLVLEIFVGRENEVGAAEEKIKPR
jgi:hypothetical protein